MGTRRFMGPGSSKGRAAVQPGDGGRQEPAIAPAGGSDPLDRVPVDPAWRPRPPTSRVEAVARYPLHEIRRVFEALHAPGMGRPPVLVPDFAA
ncbi:MAG: hypothetical protein D6729_15560 [Deltaproteobacteria bacterium]|nr:MAG: hypothetical protein D6729_15560 [Deltaproteobacteria bacterium]